jgi:uncharacterized protein YndB with AHSA1/START domain
MAEHADLVLERTLDAPRELVWRAWTDSDHIKQWWAPRPYQTPEVELDLRPGGVFYTRMTGPDGFDARGTGCILEVVEAEKIVWTSALGPGYRPQDLGSRTDPDDCNSFPFTAIVTFADSGDGRTLYKAVALHRNAADRDIHEKMGFHEGWGTCAEQLGEVAKSLRETV